MLGRTPRILKSGKHDDQFYTDLWRRLLAGEAYRGSLINRKKSGELYWAEQTINPIRNDGDEITHFVSVVKDLTTLREKQEQEFHLQLAREVQQRYYTLIPPAIPGFDIAGTAHAAVETGGDYFDFLPQPDGSLYLVIADVVGHGFGSALIMAETRAALRAYVSMVSDIRCLLKLMNRDLVGSLGANRFVTMLLARLDPTNRVLEYASAGHEPGYVLRCSGEFETLDSTAPPLGLFADGDFGARVVVPLNEGDTVVLLTDGITESTNGQDDPLGVGAVLDCIARNPDDSADLLVERLYEMARSFSGNGRQLDDMTSIICKVGTPG